MNFFALSGSGRLLSTNTAMLRALARVAAPEHSVLVFDRVAALPVFTPDREGAETPSVVEDYAAQIGACDGVIIACPEYVRSMPGGLKNAIDWLVSREEIIKKPVALLHASHRGDDMLGHLRAVLETVSERFTADVFARFDLMSKSPAEIEAYFTDAENRGRLEAFLQDFADFCSKSEAEG